jgi:hypothetical protein
MLILSDTGILLRLFARYPGIVPIDPVPTIP